jgi:ketosteroid isomerase-like protein
MAQENVTTVRAFYEAWNSGDMDVFRDLYDPDVVLRPPEGWPEPGPFVGRETVMSEWERVRDAWDANVVEPIGDFIDAGDRIVVRHTWRGAARGPEVSLAVTNVLTVPVGCPAAA